MHSQGRSPNALFGVTLRPESAVVAIMVLLLFLIFVFLFLTLTAPPAEGQTYHVIHSFSGGRDGGQPWAGLIINRGILYGTTATGGNHGFGLVFRMGSVLAAAL